MTPFVLFTPFDATWRAANGYLKNIEDINDRGQVLLAAMQNSTGLIIPSVLIDREDERRKEVRQNDLKILTEDDLASVKDLLLSKIKAESAAVEQFLANPYFMSIFNKWKILVGEDEPREWVSKIVANDAFFLKLLKVFTIAEHSQVLGDYSVQRTKKFRLDWFKDFADLDQVADAVKRLMSLHLLTLNAKHWRLIKRRSLEILTRDFPPPKRLACNERTQGLGSTSKKHFGY